MVLNLNPGGKVGGLYIPRESIGDPFILVQAYAENACANGVEFHWKLRVTGIETEQGKIKRVLTTTERLKLVI